jgi:hypothetical protein
MIARLFFVQRYRVRRQAVVLLGTRPSPDEGMIDRTVAAGTIAHQASSRTATNLWMCKAITLRQPLSLCTLYPRQAAARHFSPNNSNVMQLLLNIASRLPSSIDGSAVRRYRGGP